MTEDEALSLVCPTTRSHDSDAKCIGSRCMAWRTIRVPMSKDHAWDENGQPKQIVRVFCGLAGPPA